MKIFLPVLSPGARDKFGGKNPAAIFLAAFHHAPELSPAQGKKIHFSAPS
jgi:hypothetical protein